MVNRKRAKKSKLSEILSTFGKKEADDLKQFVFLGGNIINENQKNALFKMLEPIGKRKKANERKIFNQHFNNDSKTISKAKNRILKVVFRFIKFKAFEQDDLMGDYFLLSYLQANKSIVNLNYEFDKIDKDSKEEGYHSKFISLGSTFLSDFKLPLTETTRDENGLNFIRNISKDLKEFYIKKQLQLAVEYINRYSIINKKPHPSKPKEFKFLLNYKTDEPNVLAWQLILTFRISSKAKQVANFNVANKYVHKNYLKIDDVYLQDFVVLLVNFCYYKLREGKYEFADLIWNNYMLRFKSGILNKVSFVNPIFYLNIILLSCINKCIAAIKDQLNDVKKKLDYSNPEITKAALTIAAAAEVYYFNPKLIRSSLAKLIDFYTKDEELQLQHDILKTKMLFDIEEFDEIEELKIYNTEKYECEEPRVLNFFKAIEHLITKKSIKNLHKKVYFHSDYIWLSNKQKNQ